MKAVLILPGEIDFCPYLEYYIDVFESRGIEYEFISWNRYGNKSKKNESRIDYCFNLYSPYTNSFVKKLLDFRKFSSFVRDCLIKTNYDLVIVHTLVNGLFLKDFLLKEYKNRYIYDIRDYSIVFPFFKKSIKKLIENSAFTAISSNGFLQWLPKEFDYVISHNIRKKKVQSALNERIMIPDIKKEHVVILTIGQIRHYSTNVRLINSLGNKNKMSLVFAGWGIESEKLKKYAENKFSNITFKGRYEKQKECTIVEKSDFLNVILPVTLLERTLISNRFYLSLVFKKPMIVNQESVQADLIKRYKLGIVVKKSDNIHEKIVDYISNYDKISFEKGCKELLKRIEIDINEFENKVLKLLTKK